jgi:hypothetical protein
MGLTLEMVQETSDLVFGSAVDRVVHEPLGSLPVIHLEGLELRAFLKGVDWTLLKGLDQQHFGGETSIRIVRLRIDQLVVMADIARGKLQKVDRVINDNERRLERLQTKWTKVEVMDTGSGQLTLYVTKGALHQGYGNLDWRAGVVM